MILQAMLFCWFYWEEIFISEVWWETITPHSLKLWLFCSLCHVLEMEPLKCLRPKHSGHSRNTRGSFLLRLKLNVFHERLRATSFWQDCEITILPQGNMYSQCEMFYWIKSNRASLLSLPFPRWLHLCLGTFKYSEWDLNVSARHKYSLECCDWKMSLMSFPLELHSTLRGMKMFCCCNISVHDSNTTDDVRMQKRHSGCGLEEK